MSVDDLPIDRRSPLLSLYSSRWAQRAVPDAVAMSAAALAGRMLWLWPSSRRRAMRRMSLVVARTPHEPDVRKLARRQVRHWALVTELNVRPWMLHRAPVEGRERLIAAAESGRPVLIMITHTGLPADVQASAVGLTVHVLAHRFLDPEARVERSGWGAYKARNQYRRLRSASLELVLSGKSYGTLRGLLEDGEIVMIAPDVPGRMRTTVAGKNAYLGSGLAHLAMETGALVVPLVGRIQKRRPTYRVDEPIDSRSFATPQALLDHLAAILTTELLQAPEQHDLNTFWRELWADDSDGYELDLWLKPRRPHRLRRRVRGKLARVRGQLATRD